MLNQPRYNRTAKIVQMYYSLIMDASELDLLPDHVDWRDEGCDLFPSCLSCPLPRCAEEMSRGRQRLRMSARARHIANLKASGRSTSDIARLFGLTTRTVQRNLASVRDNGERSSLAPGGRGEK